LAYGKLLPARQHSPRWIASLTLAMTNFASLRGAKRRSNPENTFITNIPVNLNMANS
jgi:hypothetical protein